MRKTCSILLLLLLSSCGTSGSKNSGFRFEISFPESVSATALDGRMLLLVSNDLEREPRFTAVNWRNPQPFFGIDVEALAPGQQAVIDSSVIGFPVESIADIPAGEYNVQAVLNVYTTFRRSDGHVVQMHMDRWEGQQWNRSPGNIYSPPQTVRIDPSAGEAVRLSLTQVMPAIDPPRDTPYVKHVKIRSELVSRFWGTDMYIGAVVLLPHGFDSHPDSRYPVAYMQGHFTPTIRGFREEPPEPSATGAARASQEAGYRFFQEWSSGRLPRFLVVIPQDPTPYYDDSY
ncbi:MAG: hypothetical protein FJW35_16205, partial [Acidobacteria bacterium]|nr:hypothetical protein [Acidobacteriota bacterium]